MKFITNSFSPLMFEESSLDFSKHELKEDQFKVLIKGAQSYVSHYDVAERIGVPVNNRPLRARAGDVILQALLQSNGVMTYHCYQIKKCETPLLRSYETTEERA